jgi:uncharacterized membrane protein YfcA
MDWLYLHMPISGVDILWPGLVILGFGVGVIGGFFGMGGAWMVTPGLNILGFPMAFAIGTDIAHMAGKSIISTMRHGKFGNVDYKLGLCMVLGTVGGVEIGAQLVMRLEQLGNVESIVRYAYVILLALIAWMIFYDIRKVSRSVRESEESGRSSSGIAWYKTLHRIHLPPMVTFQQSGIRCSLWLPVIVGLFTGLLAGFLGIGGGLICMPCLIYLVGCPTHVAVGTDLFQVMITGLYGTFSYTYKGRTELVAVLVMLVGAAIGAQIGAVATKYIKGYGIRTVFGMAVLGCMVTVILKQLGTFLPGQKALLNTLATVVVLTLVAALALYIAVRMVQGAAREIAQRKAEAAR